MSHGRKSTYDRHKCRCNECRQANTEYMRTYRRNEYMKRKREAA